MISSRKQRKYLFNEDRHIEMCVYCITNKENNRKYVGQSVGQVGQRWRSHINKSGAGISVIKKAIQKYGHESFNFEVIEIVSDRAQLDIQEKKWIKELNTLAPNGYNLCDGGSSGRIFSEESRKKMSESAIKRCNGRISPKRRRSLMTQEEKDTARQARIRKMAESKKGKPTWLSINGMTKEMIEKARNSKIGVPVPAKWKPLVDNNGTRYESVKSTVEKIGCGRTTLSKHLAGKLKTVYGLTYKYI